MSKKFIVAVDLGGTNLKIGILDLKYNIRRKEVLSTGKFDRKEDLILAIESGIKSIIRAAFLKQSSILGIGLGLPGPVDSKRGIVHFFPNIPGWREVNLKELLEKRLKLPVVLDNDAKLMALAEYKLGDAGSFRNVLCITLGTGVGGGLILEKRLYRGEDNAAGEIGHLPINEKGPRCNCGGVACLESYLGNNRIRQEASKIFSKGISLEELSALSKKGNQKAINIWEKTGERLGIALAGAVNLLNLDAIIIGGGVANAGKILFEKLKITIRLRGMSVQSGRVKIFKARLGENAGLIGAAILVKEGRG